ncbi:saccharopine dehydrogenase family protein [Ferrimonas senticii]|uniref:saccharopine dehydrogenase family protein n=1 Tax=Ferrimonas senticii TaxID=394566 RepID=UPI00040120B2|nr:saccharopine dehydrogenase NADP-binding domain-containing protein [Ferrimonas senticii]
MTAPFDLIVYGATGFTGQLICRYLQQHYHGQVRWAIAGRNADKLAQLHQQLQLGDEVSCISASADSPEQLQQLVAQTKAVIAVAGPYQRYGEPLLAACAHSGTHYLDLCGEPAWMRQMIDKYHAVAADSGAVIVHSCGFDSIPSDLGVYQLQQLALSRFGQTLPQVKGRVEAMQGGPSGGTVASFMVSQQAAQADAQIGQWMLDPFALTPGFHGSQQPDGSQPKYDDDLGRWASPFVMALINCKNVHRTNWLLGHPYGEQFQYDEMISTGAGEQGQQVAQALAKGDGLVGQGKPPKPGEGPTPEEQENGFFTLAFYGQHQGETLRVAVSGDKDPGYGCTSMMISEAALCLLQQQVAGGFWTPASAMAEPLIARLAEKQVLRFQ